MTKLMQWLTGIVLFLAVYLALVFDVTPLRLPSNCREVVVYSPLYILMTFACYSLAVIGYRVATFNDCAEAAEELKQQIEEARRDLKSKGLKL